MSKTLDMLLSVALIVFILMLVFWVKSGRTKTKNAAAKVGGYALVVILITCIVKVIVTVFNIQ